MPWHRQNSTLNNINFFNENGTIKQTSMKNISPIARDLVEYLFGKRNANMKLWLLLGLLICSMTAQGSSGYPANVESDRNPNIQTVTEVAQQQTRRIYGKIIDQNGKRSSGPT